MDVACRVLREFCKKLPLGKSESEAHWVARALFLTTARASAMTSEQKLYVEALMELNARDGRTLLRPQNVHPSTNTQRWPTPMTRPPHSQTYSHDTRVRVTTRQHVQSGAIQTPPTAAGADG